MTSFRQLGLIGCGLMGGSFALAAKKSGLVDSVIGYSKSPQNVELAKSLGVVDMSAASILQAAIGSDLIVICVPIAATYEVFKSLQFGLSSDTLIMDVGSTKQSVLEATIKALGELPPNFVPAHPIAGKEKSGVSEADALLYKDRRVILTPSSNTNPEFTRMASDLWGKIGSHVTCMSAQEHDAIFAAVSHAPHLLAFAYVNALNGQAQAADFWRLAGPGFRDFSRIAGSDPEVWRDILISNRHEIMKQIATFKSALDDFERAIVSGDANATAALISGSSLARRQWQMNSDTLLPELNDEQ